MLEVYLACTITELKCGIMNSHIPTLFVYTMLFDCCMIPHITASKYTYVYDDTLIT